MVKSASLLLVGLLLLTMGAVAAQTLPNEIPPTPDPEQAASETAAHPQAPAPSEAPASPEAPAPTPAAPAPSAPADMAASSPTLDQVLCELEELRMEVLRLQQTVNMYLNGAAADLKAENEALRSELKELYRERGLSLPAVPAPHRKLLEEILRQQDSIGSAPDNGTETNAPEEPAADTSEADAPEMPSEAAKNSPDESTREEAADVAKAIRKSGYAVISEWGRSPEDSAKINPKAASVKGMICVAAAGATEKDLTDLGRKLRAQFDGYDNINIEVFDNLETAREFRDTYIAQPGHRVLSVSKHRASGRDVILVIQGEITREIPAKEVQ